MKQLALTFTLVLLTLPVFAQGPGGHHGPGGPGGKEKLDALRIAFFTEKLNLTPEESSVFWARFNELEAEMKQIHEERKALKPNFKEIQSKSDSEIRDKINAVKNLEIREIELKTKFTLDCFDILDAQRAAKLPILEREFKRAIVEQKKREKSRPGGHRGR